MSDLRLVIGDKNYSSWSLRAWLMLKMAGLPFEEIKISLRRPDTLAAIRRHSPSGKVPLLYDGDLRVWESLAIAEYLAERVRKPALWPADATTRAMARAVSAEMHAGFANLRREFPMDCRLREKKLPEGDAATDIARVTEIWRECRERFGKDGPFLFGAFSLADCMFAPVASRFLTYDVVLDPVSSAYRDAVLALPAMQDWIREAAAER